MGGKTGTTTQSVQIPKEVLARYNAVNAQAQSVASTPFQKYSTDPNDFVAGMNQQQFAGVGGINRAAGMAQPSIAYAQQGFTPEGFQQGVQGYMNPYLQNAMGATAAQMQNVNQQQQNQLTGNAISAGAFGGDRAGIARNNLINQQNLAMGQTLGQMANQGYQQSAQNYMTGLGQIGQLGLQGQQAALQGAQAQLGAGTLEQQTQQAGQTALYNQFLQQQAYPFQVAQFLANIAMGTGGLSGSNTTTTQPMPFFSDRRLKKNIERIGETDEGLPIHKFEYKGDPKGQKHIGLMADEVEQIHPEAVGTHKSGYKVVDYDKATSEGGAVQARHEGLGFAAGGDVAAGLKAMNAMQANMPVTTGGVDAGLAAAAREIAPQPNVPKSVFYQPEYNPFADPKYQPDFAKAGAGAGTGSEPASGFDKIRKSYDSIRRNSGDNRSDRSNPFSDNSYTADSYGMINDRFGGIGNTGGYDPTQGAAFADGGRAGYQTAGAVMPQQYNPMMDPNFIDNIVNRHLAMYDRLERGHNVPSGRSLSGGIGKYGRVPESNLPVSQLRTAGSAPSLPDSVLKQGLAAGSDFSDLFTKGKSVYDYFSKDNKAHGGPVGYATDGSVKPNDPTEDIYSEQNTGSTKRDIPTKFDRTKLPEAAKPPTPTSKTGLGLGDILSIGKFAMGLPFFNQGGRAGFDNGGGIDFSKFSETVRPVAEEFVKKYPQFPITSGHRTQEHNTKVGGAEGSQHLHGGAFDFGTGKAPDQEVESAIRWLQSKGLKGFGYYPDSRSVHADEAGERYWGPDFTKKSLPQTPAWFQKIAGLNPDENKTRGLSAEAAIPASVERDAASLSAVNAAPAGGEVERKAPESGGGLNTDRTTNTDLLLSILGGVGTMASSNSPFLGAAILQGLGGGAKTYSGLRGQQSEMALRESEMLKNTMGLLNDRFQPLPESEGGGFYDLWTGKKASSEDRAAMGIKMGLPPSFFGGSDQGLAGGQMKDGFPLPPPPKEDATQPQAGLGAKPPAGTSAPKEGLGAGTVDARRDTKPMAELPRPTPLPEPSAAPSPAPSAQGQENVPAAAPAVSAEQDAYEKKIKDLQQRARDIYTQVDQDPRVRPYLDGVKVHEQRIAALNARLEETPPIQRFQEVRSNLTQQIATESGLLNEKLKVYQDVRNKFAEPQLRPINQELDRLGASSPSVTAAETEKMVIGEQAKKNVEVEQKAADFIQEYPGVRQTMDGLINAYTKVDMNRLAEVQADMIGFVKSIPALDQALKQYAGLDVDDVGFQGLADAAQKEAVTQAFRQLGKATTNMQLQESLATVAEPSRAPAAKYSVVTKQIARLNQMNDMYQDFINRENKKENWPQFQVQWNKNPENSIGKYEQDAVNSVPYFAGMSLKDIEKLAYKNSNLMQNADGTKVKDTKTGTVWDARTGQILKGAD